MGGAHIPVLLDEVVQGLIRPEYRLFVDATVGGGGHTYSILNTYPNLRAYAIDLDDAALVAAKTRLEPFRDRVKLKRANFSALKEILGDDGISTVDAVLFDLGVSTFQLEGERGFSFKDTHTLDMRMDQRQEQTALQVVNSYTFDALKQIIGEYGEEWKAAQIARAIVTERRKAPVTSARELAEIVVKIARRTGKIHPATKTFQAIRMEVNQELRNLETGLYAAIELLAPSGRVGVISFHSLEDRIAKRILKAAPGMTVVTKKPIRPGRVEIARNPRSRSAKLRIAEKNGKGSITHEKKSRYRDQRL
ncbi:MAG TPA: 16S rRNA (cytosine(1402)-N(4))-methyltransferase RsmH [Syntrophorhabdales bacterium]|nr:16S rRNA (cytosine(1402)-N(4))-methyltransferase RsmH [Syntrophorhabdales bacterium]